MANQQVITSIEELKPLLGHHFVVLFGSAISGAMEPKLPMIDGVMNTFLEQAAAQLAAGTYRDKVIAGYAENLVNGYHNALLKQTKFENFIFDLQRSVGKQTVDDLFIRIFSCSGKQYNRNHAAIAFLLRTRKCLAALTTNFDNQLELSLPGLKTYIFPHRPKRVPNTNHQPIYVKLHGDAPTRTYVATSPQLSQAKSIDTYAFIEELLRDQTVIILGYSGKGDIDIAPHLGKHEKLLIWGDYNPDPTKAKHSNQIEMKCDLSLTDPKTEKEGRRNLLLDLAASYGWRPSRRKFAGQPLKWRDELVEWTQQIPPNNLRRFITSFMSWSTSWPHVHIAYLGLRDNDSYENRLEYALSMVQVAAYNSSERILKSLLMMEPPSLQLYLRAIELRGFTDWGKRRYSKALSTYLGILKLYKLVQEEWKARPDKDVEKFISSAARQYLEVLLEVINNERRNDKRKEIVRNSGAEYAMSFLKNMQFDTSYYLNHIALLEAGYWMGSPISPREVREFFDQCMAMQEWDAAALTVQFMLTLSRDEGEKAVKEILPQLRNRGSHKLIIKVNARMLYERLNRLIPVQVFNFKAFTKVLLIGVEIIFAFKRLLWNLDRWTNQVRVETGFLRLGKIVSVERKRSFKLGKP